VCLAIEDARMGCVEYPESSLAGRSLDASRKVFTMSTTPPAPRRARPGEAIQFLRDLPLDSSDCINWPFARDANGYGVATYRYQSNSASRVSAILHVPNTERKPFVLHQPEVCHNPLCVNPAHLRWGTHTENMADRVLDGTDNTSSFSGERNPSAKLTDKQAKYIYSLKGGTLTKRQISKMFGIAPKTVSKIWSGRAWSSVTKAPRRKK